MVNCNNDTLNISSLKGKYLLLEFWATWCSSCLKKLPMLDSLQRIHAADLQIILVGRKSNIDNRQRVLEFFQKRKTASGENYSLPTLVGDTVLNNLFPHQEIPYAVLLDKEQKILAFLTYNQLTPQHLENLIKKKATADNYQDNHTQSLLNSQPSPSTSPMERACPATGGRSGVR